MITHKLLTEKYVKGSSSSVFKEIFQHLHGGNEENHGKPLSGNPVSTQTFKLGTT
jgi:hypothetical protein